MNNTDRFFVRILGDYINGIKSSKCDFSDVDGEKLKELARIHKLSGVCYSYLKNVNVSTNIDTNVIQYLEMGFYAQLALYQKRSMVQNMLKQMFDDNGINHIWIKGSQIASMYPNPELRTMSDLDIVIEPNNRERFHELIMSKGAKYKMEESDETVRVYRIYDINLEIHTSLVSPKNWMNGVNFSDYFSDVFSHKVSVGGCSYVLQEEYNIIYSIFHIAKHFYGHGCGIRMLLDIPVLIRSSKEINWDDIWSEFERLKLTGFASRIFMICEDWFGVFGVQYKKKYIFKSKEIIEDYIISGGVYGFEGRNTDVVQIKHQGSSREGGYSFFRGMLNWAFPSYGEMRQCSQWFHNKPAILLPIAYLERFVRNAKERGGIIKWSREIASGRKELDEKATILDIMDLK